MTTERLVEIVRGLLKARNQPVDAVNVLPSAQHTCLVAIRFGFKIETQRLIDIQSESEEAVIERLGKWLDLELRTRAPNTGREARWYSV